MLTKKKTKGDYKEQHNMSMEILKELTQELTSFPIADVDEENYKEYALGLGTGIDWTLFRSNDITVTKWFCTEGGSLDKHTHEQREFIVVYKGAFIVTIRPDDPEPETRRLNVGDCIVIDASVPHSCVFPSDCWCISITVPATKDY